jgi:hypothetical protein
MLFWPLSSDANACRRVQHRLRETGSLTSTVVINAGRPRTVRAPANEDAIFVFVEQEPSKSVRDIARVSPEVFLVDHPLWIQLCDWLLHQRAVDVLWLHSILWVYERVFCMRVCHTVTFGAGHISSANACISSTSTSAFGLTSSGYCLGPRLLSDRLTAQRCRNYLETLYRCYLLKLCL